MAAEIPGWRCGVLSASRASMRPRRMAAEMRADVIDTLAGIALQ